MAQSINTRVDVVVEATSYQGLTNYGKIMVGDKGFEFFNTRNVNDYIQIPKERKSHVMRSRQRKMEHFHFHQKNLRKCCVRSISIYHPNVWCVL